MHACRSISATTASSGWCSNTRNSPPREPRRLSAAAARLSQERIAARRPGLGFYEDVLIARIHRTDEYRQQDDQPEEQRDRRDEPQYEDDEPVDQEWQPVREAGEEGGLDRLHRIRIVEDDEQRREPDQHQERQIECQT